MENQTVQIVDVVPVEVVVFCGNCGQPFKPTDGGFECVPCQQERADYDDDRAAQSYPWQA